MRLVCAILLLSSLHALAMDWEKNGQILPSIDLVNFYNGLKFALIGKSENKFMVFNTMNLGKSKNGTHVIS